MVTEGPKSVFTTGTRSNTAPVTRASGSSTMGMSRPIAVPVTTPTRRPSQPVIAPARASIRRWSQRTAPTPFSTWSKES